MAGADIAELEDSTGLDNMQQLIELRWIAVIGQVATISVVHFVFEIRLPLHRMAFVLLCLAAFNVASFLRWRAHREVTNGTLFLALLVDVATLTAQLYLSGGATNPFSFLYLLQVILAAVLLETRSVWSMVLITCGCFIGLTAFHRPLPPPEHYTEVLFSPYIEGTFISFALNAALLVTFITRINHNLRARDARLAALRERASEEDHIIRMGLLASGAAHELGTPLSTVSVIVNDWRHMPVIAGNAEMLQEIDEMQAQLERCKSIVTGVLLSAGEARGESPVETSLCTFLDDLATEWRTTRNAGEFAYANRFGDDLRIVSDTALKQMICNVLDNALEASGGWVGLEVTRGVETLRLQVTDRGPGFAPRILAHLGEPYQSTKKRPGAGLGLFLASNVARVLGGTLAAENLPAGGALVTLTLPLRSIALPDAS